MTKNYFGMQSGFGNADHNARARGGLGVVGDSDVKFKFLCLGVEHSNHG